MKSFHKIKILLFAAILFIACNSKSKENHDGHNLHKEVVYTCSMHPQVRQNKPGKCPICHMDLIPVQDKVEEKENPNEISLSDQQIKLGNITTQNMEEIQQNIDQSFNGVVVVNQEKVNTLSTTVMGRIEKLFVKSTGDFVKKGQPIYTLYSEDLAIAKEDYNAAYKQIDMPGNFGKNAKNILNAAKLKLEFYGLTKNQINDLKSAQDTSPYTTFYSKYEGYVTEIVTKEGSYAMEGAPVIKLADLTTLWVEAQISSNYSNSIKIGQKGIISFSDFPNKKVATTVVFINPEIDPNTRFLVTRFKIENLGLDIKPGMQAVVKLLKQDVKGVFIPIDAVIREENASYIWVEKRKGVFKNVMVETGIETNGMIEIKSELNPSEKIVVTGSYAINSEYKFRVGSDPMEGMKM